jgi:hypothetical protein
MPIRAIRPNDSVAAVGDLLVLNGEAESALVNIALDHRVNVFADSGFWHVAVEFSGLLARE